MHTYMTREEIIYRYTHMDKDTDRIQILAELNACTYDNIADVVGMPHKPSRMPLNVSKAPIDETILRMYQMGCTDSYIGRKFNVTGDVITSWRRRRKLHTNNPHHLKATDTQIYTWDMIFGEENNYEYDKQLQKVW